MRKLLVGLAAIVFVLLGGTNMAMATDWTEGPAGTGSINNSLVAVGTNPNVRIAYFLVDAIERSPWIEVGIGLHGRICVTADTTDELANNIQIDILESILAHDETPDPNYSSVVLGVTLTGTGDTRCIDGLQHGWYLVDSKTTPSAGSALVSLKSQRQH